MYQEKSGSPVWHLQRSSFHSFLRVDGTADFGTISKAPTKTIYNCRIKISILSNRTDENRVTNWKQKGGLKDDEKTILCIVQDFMHICAKMQPAC
jgi:hypothetical protein